ncbi:MAG: tRNA pseudouridine(55) synthase TruB [bacterium]
MLNGVLLIDKPRGWTSHDAVAKVRGLTGERRVGHTGTLDPMATGLLVLCVGRATRVAQFLEGLDKVYFAEITFGIATDTYDADGREVSRAQFLAVNEAEVRSALEKFIGPQQQTPPPYSAIKVKGKKLYEYARAGEKVETKPRRVIFHSIEILSFDSPRLTVRAKVSSGTYVRSFAHDLGQRLGCGAHLSALRREAIGHFSLDRATPLSDFENNPSLLPAKLLSLAQALSHLPQIIVSPEMARLLANGRPLDSSQISANLPTSDPDQFILALDEAGREVAVLQRTPANHTILKPVRVLTNP